MLQVPCIQVKQDYPTYVVCAWLGNTPAVAPKYELPVTDEHSETASKTGDQLGTQTPAGTRTDAHKNPAPLRKCGKTRVSRMLRPFLTRLK